MLMRMRAYGVHHILPHRPVPQFYGHISDPQPPRSLPANVSPVYKRSAARNIARKRGDARCESPCLIRVCSRDVQDRWKLKQWCVRACVCVCVYDDEYLCVCHVFKCTNSKLWFDSQVPWYSATIEHERGYTHMHTHTHTYRDIIGKRLEWVGTQSCLFITAPGFLLSGLPCCYGLSPAARHAFRDTLHANGVVIHTRRLSLLYYEFSSIKLCT